MQFSRSPSSVLLYECLRHEELLIRSQGGHIPPWQPVCAAQATGGGGNLVGWGRYRCGLAQVDDGHSSFVAVEVTAFYSYIPLM